VIPTKNSIKRGTFFRNFCLNQICLYLFFINMFYRYFGWCLCEE